MQISGVSYQPYIYNTNAISSNSLSKVNPIGDDLLASKTDFSGLTDKQENVNPLRRGQTPNFMEILDMQMQMGRMNAARVMKPAQTPPEAEATQAVTALKEDTASNVAAQTPAVNQAAPAEPTETFRPVTNAEQMQSARQADSTLYQMQRAADAYAINMTA